VGDVFAPLFSSILFQAADNVLRGQEFINEGSEETRSWPSQSSSKLSPAICNHGFCCPETHGGDYFSTCEGVISDLKVEQIADFFSTALRLKKSGYRIASTDIFFLVSR
jgi:hypothetical protein